MRLALLSLSALLLPPVLVFSAQQGHSAVVSLMRQFITEQMAQKQLPALSVVIVDDQQIVWAEGFGFADPEKKIPAGPETDYRIGSVSKLFTDIGVMQLVERGQIDLDAPITKYIPDFHPKNPF
ncbi:MAG: beta-lactamase family protein, partial [Acidobacteriaceae bacterium]|nr:beta-lactamase family protein [Acidobacteriaceae bacterium]